VLRDNVTSREFNDQAQVHKTTVMTRILQLVHEICTKGIHVTKRDLFYTDVKLFEDQKNSDAVLDDVSCMLGCTRSSLNVVASEKGIVVGRLRFTEDGDSIDCSKARAPLRTLDCAHPLASDGRGRQDHPAAHREGAKLHERRALYPAGGEGCSLHAASRGPLLQPLPRSRSPPQLPLHHHHRQGPARRGDSVRLQLPHAPRRPLTPRAAACF
jgi:Type IIB DNA topoisomerase